MSQFRNAQEELLILLGPEPGSLENEDGDLQFRMARCCQELGDGTNAAKYYLAAIKHRATKRVEAYRRRATLLRGQPGKQGEADEFIEEMVKSDSKNYQVYLERGRYRRYFKMDGAKGDFQEALKLSTAEGRVEVVLEEVSMLAETEKRPDEARKTLQKELETAPGSVALNDALIRLELRDHKDEKAIEILHRILNAYPNSVTHVWLLAKLLAKGGATRELEVQIEELKRIGFPPKYLQFLKAWYNINKNEYAIARDLLVLLQAEVAENAELKPLVSSLLAQCYRQLGDSEMEQEAYLQTLKAAPGDTGTRLRWIEILINRGEVDRAIEECQALVGKEPRVRIPLAQLLIDRNQRRSADKRDWGQVESLIVAAAAAAPDAVEVRILQAKFLLGQGKAAEAEKVLDAGRAKNPKSVEICLMQIALMRSQGRVDEARKLLDKAQEQLGDQVDLLLAQAELSATKQGPEVIALLNKLAQKIDRFSKKEDRYKLLNGLALVYLRHEDPQSAGRLWSQLSQLADQFPDDIEARLKLIDLAILVADKEVARKNTERDKDEVEKDIEQILAATAAKIAKFIEQIERIEGGEGLRGRYVRVSSLVWQAGRATDKGKQEKLRTEARQGINELMSRRADSSLIHLLSAKLDEQELVELSLVQRQIQGKAELDEQELARLSLVEKQMQVKLDSVINSYLRAIELGQRDSKTVRRAAQLLFAARRGNEALELYNRSSVRSQPGDDGVERAASRQAFKNKDFARAEEIARKALVANPGDFAERLWLAELLLMTGRQDAAETELRQAVELAKDEPDRWIKLVEFLAATKQPEKAEKAFEEARTNLAKLAPPKASLALAECCQFVGRAYEGASNADAVKKWFGEARGWFEKARAAQPNDPSIAVRFAQFFLQTKQMNEAVSHLEAILGSSSGDKVAVAAASWARRELASTLIATGDPERARKALALFEPTDRTGAASKAPDGLEDQRVLAKVLDAQRTAEHRKRAIEIMSSLVGKNPQNLEDRLLLAKLDEFAGDWPRAREQYDELIMRTENLAPEAGARRAVYLDQYIRGLLRHRRAGDDQELIKARELVDKLKSLQPDELNTLVLEVLINRVQGQFEKDVVFKQTEDQVAKAAALKRAQDHLDKATALIHAFANRPDLTLTALGTLADQAEGLNELDLAEKLQRQIADQAPTPRGKLGLPAFLSRRGRIKDALDLCGPLWATTGEPERLARLCASIVLRPDGTADPAELKRVIEWLTTALTKHPQSTTLMVILAELQESQGLYQEAEALYRRAIELGDRGGKLGLAMLLGRRGHVKEALDLCEPLWPTTREPEQLAKVCARVVLGSKSGTDPAQLKRVIDWLTQALTRYPQSTTLMVTQANLLERHGLYQDAEAFYRRAIEQGDLDGLSHNNLAWLLALKDGGNLKDALDFVNRAIDLKGPQPDFLDTRGIVYLAAGENRRAITDLEKAVAGAPSPSKYFHLAEAYLKDNKKAEAKKNWEAAKIKAWEQSGLHALEQTAYNKVRDELGMP